MCAQDWTRKRTFEPGSTASLLKTWQRKPIVDLVKSLAESKNATPAQIALAWLLVKRPWIVPIPGTRNPDHLNENLGAIDVELTPADLQMIETAISKITVRGGRMNEMQMQQVDQTI